MTRARALEVTFALLAVCAAYTLLGFTLGADWQKRKEIHDHQAVHVTEKGGHSERWECR